MRSIATAGPALLAVTDIDDARLSRAASLLTAADAQSNGVKLVYVNTSRLAEPRGAPGFADRRPFHHRSGPP